MLYCSLKSLETLVKMGERIAVKPGSAFERTSSQKKQLALQTEKSTVGISMFHDLASADLTALSSSGSFSAGTQGETSPSALPLFHPPSDPTATYWIPMGSSG